MSTVQNYYDALLALSGNPALAAARNGLLVGMSGEDLIDVITCGLKTGVSREGLNTIATQLFEEIAATQAGVGVAPVEDKDVGDVADDSEDIVRGKGRTPRRRAERGSKESRSTQLPQSQPAQTPTARATRSSTSNRKRKGSNLARAGKKTRTVDLESEAEEEDQVQTQISDEEEEAEIIVGDVTEGDANAAGDTDSDTDATPDEIRVTPWTEIQEESVMLDLSLTDSEDGRSSDEDYTEEFADTELTCGGIRDRPPATSESLFLPEIDVVFRVPTAEGFDFKEMDEFPIAFVKEMTRKFNHDFLRKSKHRTQFRKMMKEVNDADTCVYRLLDAPPPPEPEEPKPALIPYSEEWCEEHHHNAVYGGDEQQKPREIYSTRACPCCYEEKRLCARFIRSDELEPRLVIYPLGVAEMNGGDWRSMGFWVRKLTGFGEMDKCRAERRKRERDEKRR